MPGLSSTTAAGLAPLWRILGGVAEHDWTDAIDMTGAQVAVAAYRPDWWPTSAIRRAPMANSTCGISPHFRPRRHRLDADAHRREMADRFSTCNEITRLTTAA